MQSTEAIQRDQRWRNRERGKVRLAPVPSLKRSKKMGFQKKINPHVMIAPEKERRDARREGEGGRESTLGRGFWEDGTSRRLISHATRTSVTVC